MYTLSFRALRNNRTDPKSLEKVATQMGETLADLTGATVLLTTTPITEKGGDTSCYLRWQTHQSRNRVVLESTWHPAQKWMRVDAITAANPYHRSAALYVLCQLAGEAGYDWAAMWRDGAHDDLADGLEFWDAATWQDEVEGSVPPFGQTELANGMKMEWLNSYTSPRVMSRLIFFGEDCTINWESLIVTDLMQKTSATYLELRVGNRIAGLVRIICERHLPGMDGYDPRGKSPAIAYDIESIEVHPDYRGQGLAGHLVRAVQGLGRPVFTLDTYKRAAPFWETVGFKHDARRSGRDKSNIYAWRPRTGKESQASFE